jgi:YVTN family beta-propeller protein
LVAPTAVRAGSTEPVAYVATREALVIVDPGSRVIESSFATISANLAHGEVAIHPLLPMAYLAAADGVDIFDLAAGRIAGTIPVTTSSIASLLRLAPNGQHLYFSNGPFVEVIDTVAERSVASLSLGNEIVDLELTADGGSLYALTDSGWLVARSTEHWEEKFDVHVPLTPRDMAVDPDGTRVLVSLPSRAAIDFMSAASGRYQGSLVIDGRPGVLAFGADARRAYVGIDQGTTSYVGIIDTEARTLLDRIPVPFALRQIVALPDDSLLLVAHPAGESCQLLILDPASRLVTGSIELPGVIDVDLGARPVLPPPSPTPTPSAGAERLCAYLTHASSGVTVVDVEARTISGVVPANDSISLLGGKDATRLYAGGGSVLTPIDTQSGRALLPITILGGFPLGMARVPGTDVAVATLNSDCTRIAAIDLVDGSQTTVLGGEPADSGLPPDDGLRSIAFDPQGRFAYAVSSALHLNELKVIDWPSGAIIGRIPFSGYRPGGIVFHPSRPLAYVTAGQLVDDRPGSIWGDRPGLLYTIDTATHTVLDQVPTDEPSFDMAISPDGSVVYVANANSDSVNVLDTNTGAIRNSIYVDNPVSVAFAPDQSVALASGHPVAIIDPATETVIDTLPAERFAQDIHIVKVPGGCVAPLPVCAGDCDGDGAVSVAEIIQALNVALDDNLLEQCGSADVDANRDVSIDEIVLAVGHALSGCPAPSL